jgi:hypothetical protein
MIQFPVRVCSWSSGHTSIPFRGVCRSLGAASHADGGRHSPVSARFGHLPSDQVFEQGWG